MDALASLEGKRAVYVTLGCKLNFAETSAIAESLRNAGVVTAARGEVADICLVNTCSVTEVADSKSRQAIRRMAREHPHAAVVVVGCYAQLRPGEAAGLEGVALVVGAENKGRIPEYLGEYFSVRERGELSAVHAAPTAQVRTFVPSCSCGGRTRYFLKVQDGCDYYCTYCTIPFARGRSRNGTVASLVEQAREVVGRGGREIVLTGVNIGDFGKTTGETFLELIQRLDEVEGIARYRIGSVEPDLLTDEVLRFCASSRAFMPHFHLPLQSGSDEVLRLMRRRYATAFFLSKVSRIRELMPDAFIGVDIIVGMRGETDGLFRSSLRFAEELPASQYHVFSYSERTGTAALRIPHRVDAKEKRERSRQMLAVSDRKTKAFYDSYISTVRPVLLEHGGRRGVRSGFTDNYIKVEVATDRDNEIVPVRLYGWSEDGTKLRGTIV